jgi:hypothetical protein
MTHSPNFTGPNPLRPFHGCAHGFQLVLMAFNGLYTAFNGFQWLLTAFNGFNCLTMITIGIMIDK